MASPDLLLSASPKFHLVSCSFHTSGRSSSHTPLFYSFCLILHLLLLLLLFFILFFGVLFLLSSLIVSFFFIFLFLPFVFLFFSYHCSFIRPCVYVMHTNHRKYSTFVLVFQLDQCLPHTTLLWLSLRILRVQGFKFKYLVMCLKHPYVRASARNTQWQTHIMISNWFQSSSKPVKNCHQLPEDKIQLHMRLGCLPKT